MSARDEAVEMIRRICPPHLSREEYGRILAEKFDTHRTEVLAEADLLPKAHVVAWLTKHARELSALPKSKRESAPDAIDRLASKVARGAIRANNLRMLPATFFEPGRSYTSTGASGITLRFVCEHVTVDPLNGRREAWGWLHRSDGTRRMERAWDTGYPHWTPEAGDRDV